MHGASSANAWHTAQRIRFADCDPHGDAHYPRIIALCERVYEEWVERAWGIDFAAMIVGRGIGTPSVELTCRFLGPLRFGDLLDLSIDVVRLGRSSATLRFTGAVAGEPRLALEIVIVTVATALNRAVPLPDEVRAALARHLAPERSDA